jgi:transketolase
MIGVAAGLATCGKIPFAASFAMFSAGRAFEQVRNSVGYPKLNVKVVGSHAGISVGEDGATHQCCEDIALMRTIPGMVILNPSDHYEMKAAVRAADRAQGPVLHPPGPSGCGEHQQQRRLSFRTRQGHPAPRGHGHHDRRHRPDGCRGGEGGQGARGRGHQRRGHQHPHDQAARRGNHYQFREEDRRVVTVEEHNIIGGLGEAVAAVLSEKCPTPVTRIGVNDVFGHSGPAVDLLKEFGLSAEHIAEVVREKLGK